MRSGPGKAGAEGGFEYGSARETWSALRGAEVAKYIPAPSPGLKNKFDRVIGTLHRCIYPKH